MLSIEHIREHPDEVRAALKTRGEDDSITEVLELDTAIRAAITERDNLNAERNRVSKELGQARSQGQEVSEEARAQMREIGNQADALNEKVEVAFNNEESFNGHIAVCSTREKRDGREGVCITVSDNERKLRSGCRGFNN